MGAIADLAAARSDLERSRKQLIREQGKSAQFRRERDLAVRQEREAAALTFELRSELGILSTVDAAIPTPPKWLIKRAGKGHRATVVSILSDTHFDEVVRPEELLGDNAYNRRIAELRLKAFVERLAQTSFDHLAGVTIDGLVLNLGGDMVTGELHDMAQTNDSSGVIETCVYWSELLAAAIGSLADAFGRVHLPCVAGNHGRLDANKRQPSKLRGKRSFDWLIYRTLASTFAHDDRVTFSIPEGADAVYSVHDTPFLLTHGNDFMSQGGVGGLYPPLLKFLGRTRDRELAARRPVPTVLLGHFHQYLVAQGNQAVVNGSLKGYDEYAHQRRFPPEPPQQAAMLVTPERGITMHWPIFVADRKREKW